MCRGLLRGATIYEPTPPYSVQALHPPVVPSLAGLASHPQQEHRQEQEQQDHQGVVPLGYSCLPLASTPSQGLDLPLAAAQLQPLGVGVGVLGPGQCPGAE